MGRRSRAVLTACVVLGLLTTIAEAAKFNWRWKNRSGETVHVELYSQARNHVWPGNGRVWVVPPDHVSYSNPITCRRGEKICYGAWVAGNPDLYWGVGKDDRQRCTNCCYRCRGRQSSVIVFDPARSPVAPKLTYQRCYPRRSGARILRTPDANDIHPDWRPPSAIGTAWSLIDVNNHGALLGGKLVSPRGGEQPGRVFVVTSEWECQ